MEWVPLVTCGCAGQFLKARVIQDAGFGFDRGPGC